MKTATIQIIQISKKKDDSFEIELKFLEKNISFLRTIPNIHTLEIEHNFEWYFEGYINEPYSPKSRIQREKKRLENYGIQLFQLLFEPEEIYNLYREYLKEVGLRGMNIEIFALPEVGFVFSSVIWEALRDPALSDAPLVAKGVGVFRRTDKRSLIGALSKESVSINVLVVTARPSEENDVAYHTIQRPLVEIMSKESKVNVRLFFLRPGTYEALQKHLRHKEDGFYHIIHFDLHGEVSTYDLLKERREMGQVRFSPNGFGKTTRTFNVRYGLDDLKYFEDKKAFLFFESNIKGEAIPISADELANLMRDRQVSVCILNACQSAKQAGAATETSLAQFLQYAGVDLIVAMRYSVSVSAAKILMSTLYKSLFTGNMIGEAIKEGRQELYCNKVRMASLGQEIDLEDWVLPVIYKRKDITFLIKKETKKEKIDRYEQFAKSEKLLNIIGRDLDILKIEKMLLQNNHLLLRGMIGVGKSTLLKYLTAWWPLTNFKNVKESIYLDFKDKSAPSRIELAKLIAAKVLPRNKFNFACTQNEYFLEGELIDWLSQNNYAIIFDNIFNWNDSNLISFLMKFKKASFFVYGSVSQELKLKQQLLKNNTYYLEGLNKGAAYQLASQIIKNTTTKQLPELMEEYAFDMEQLLLLLRGFPGVMESILPFLKKKNPTELLTQFRNNDLPFS